MSHVPTNDFLKRLSGIERKHADAVPQMVESILEVAPRHRVTDVHLVPTADALEMSWRIDGVLQPVTSFDNALKANIVARLKVLAGLLTYRTDVPQEGRIGQDAAECEMRVSTFPTVFGEKAVVTFVGGFSSHHSGGFQAALGDGSVRFISENIDPDLFDNLGNRADGELPGGF